MTLQTLSYLPAEPSAQADPSIGLSELRRGLRTIVLGYVLCFAFLAAMAALLWYVFAEVHGSHPSRRQAEDASVLLFAGTLVFGLALLFALATIVRGKWICLMNAPEAFHAKWFMFASILCVLTGPALNVGSSLIGADQTNVRRTSKNERATAALRRQFEDYKNGVPTLDTRGWTKLAGDIASFGSSLFFVLFLRAVALCWGYRGRARLAELYLVLVALLVAGTVYFIRHPAVCLAKPQFLLAMAGGLVLSFVWYFVLILATIVGLHMVRTS